MYLKYLEKCKFYEAFETYNKLKFSIFSNCSLVMKIKIKISFTSYPHGLNLQMHIQMHFSDCVANFHKVQVHFFQLSLEGLKLGFGGVGSYPTSVTSVTFLAVWSKIPWIPRHGGDRKKLYLTYYKAAEVFLSETNKRGDI